MVRTSMRHPEVVSTNDWVECQCCGRAIKDERIWRVHIGLRRSVPEYVDNSWDGEHWDDSRRIYIGNRVITEWQPQYACMDCAKDEAAAVEILGLTRTRED